MFSDAYTKQLARRATVDTPYTAWLTRRNKSKGYRNMYDIYIYIYICICGIHVTVDMAGTAQHGKSVAVGTLGKTRVTRPHSVNTTRFTQMPSDAW